MESSFYEIKKGGLTAAPLPMAKLTTHLRISELVRSVWRLTDRVKRTFRR